MSLSSTLFKGIVSRDDLFVEVGEHAFEKLVQLAMRAVELARLLT
jgi:hypothetical protein